MATAAPRPQQSTWSVPETITHLYYAPVYQTLSPTQRRIYNRLHACFCCEMLVFFEEELPMCYAIAAPNSAEVAAMLESESRHAAMFRRLAHHLDPSLYTPFRYHFLRIPPTIRRLLKFPLQHPRLFPLTFWIVLLQEERTIYYSQEIICHAPDLDPQMVETHRLHLDDEKEHLGVDEALLEVYWNRSPRWIRALNARLFSVFVGEFLNAPKRAGIRIIDRLVDEVPSLKSRKRELIAGLLGLADNDRFHQSLYSRDIVQKTFALFDQQREFRGLGSRLRGYSPEGAA